jgi:hypothetical protein
MEVIMILRSLYKSFLGFSLIAVILVFPLTFSEAHVHIHQPNGGEVFYKDSTFTIQWHIHISHPVINWDLWLSTDYGSTWNDLVIDYDNTALSYDWTIPDVNSSECIIRIRMDNSGTDYWDTTDSVFTIIGTVGAEEDSRLDNKNNTFALLENYPNPFRDQTQIRYQLPSSNHTTLKIYDLTGKLVNSIVDKHQESGVYQYRWDDKNQTSGIYLFQLQSGEYLATKKLILLR